MPGWMAALTILLSGILVLLRDLRKPHATVDVSVSSFVNCEGRRTQRGSRLSRRS